MLSWSRQVEDFAASTTGRDITLVLCQAFTLKLALAELRYVYKAANKLLPLCTNFCIRLSPLSIFCDYATVPYAAATCSGGSVSRPEEADTHLKL